MRLEMLDACCSRIYSYQMSKLNKNRASRFVSSPPFSYSREWHWRANVYHLRCSGVRIYRKTRLFQSPRSCRASFHPLRELSTRISLRSISYCALRLKTDAFVLQSTNESGAFLDGYRPRVPGMGALSFEHRSARKIARRKIVLACGNAFANLVAFNKC